MPTFSVQGTAFEINPLPDISTSSTEPGEFFIRSHPRSYSVQFAV